MDPSPAPTPYVPITLTPTIIDHVITPEEATVLAAMFPTLSVDQRAGIRAGMMVTVDQATQKKQSVASAVATGLNFLGAVAGLAIKV